MADDADRAQALIDRLNSVAPRQAQFRSLPPCEECESSPVFVTVKGTVARYCAGCWLALTNARSGGTMGGSSTNGVGG